jgi:hypothetical protein
MLNFAGAALTTDLALASTQGLPREAEGPIAKLQAKKRSEGSGITGFDFLFAMLRQCAIPDSVPRSRDGYPRRMRAAPALLRRLTLGGVLRKDTHDHIIRALTHQEAA